MFELILYSVSLLFIICLVLTLFIPLIKGAPYVPTSDKRLGTVIKFVQSSKKRGKIADIGSGDGKIIISLAKLGYEAHGYEINPFLIAQTKWKIHREKLKGKAFVYFADMWKVDYSDFDVIVVYGFARIMKELGEKLKHELKPGSLVISVAFSFPNLRLVKEENDVKLYRI